MMDINAAWSDFCDGTYDVTQKDMDTTTPQNAPKCSDLYISTKTKISYLSQCIDINNVFWEIPVNDYHVPVEGIIKKQMKLNSHSETDFNTLQKKIANERTRHTYVEEHIIQRIVNEDGRIKYKDVRKISVGLSKKDIISYRCKKKGAFYNCFVLIIRVKYNNTFKEIHVKIFNTGKLEIPGIQNDDLLIKTLDILINTIKPYLSTQLTYDNTKTETVLINSNFKCGYFIDRERLFDIIKSKYNINSSYDPCSYPGIQCEFYYDSTITIQTGKKPIANEFTKVSFMIFRTGSVLIVGKCTEDILHKIYLFVRTMLETEFNEIHIPNVDGALTSKPIVKKTSRKKTILIKK
jgi:TATA-box binding protein (TBP) (component of TFIID and TFIIIB)